MYILKHIYIILILEEIIFISKGKVRCIQTLKHYMSKRLRSKRRSSGSCIPINPKLSPRISSCFQFNFSCKFRQILYTLFILCNNCRACVELTLEIQRESIRFLQSYAHP